MATSRVSVRILPRWNGPRFSERRRFKLHHAEDKIFDVAVDQAGAVYVTGRTLSTSFPVTSGAYQSACGFCSPSMPITAGAHGFVTKLNATGSAVVSRRFSVGPEARSPPLLPSILRVLCSSPVRPCPRTFLLPVRPSLRACGGAFITLLNQTGTAHSFPAGLVGHRSTRQVGLPSHGLEPSL